MSAFEQKVEVPEKQYQYLLFAADPYETIAFKIPNMEIDFSEGKNTFDILYEYLLVFFYIFCEKNTLYI